MTVAAEDIATAREEAERAAQRAGVRITPRHTPDEVSGMQDVVEAVWGPTIRPNPDVLRALARAGAVLLAADPTDVPAGRTREPIGCAIGFLGWEGSVHLHSHQVGVRPGRQHSGVGYALKLAQRAVCLEHGITEMRWTFDPLLARNARFNFGKLGVVGFAFLPDFYGQMHDAINSGDASDRFEVSWRLDTPVTPRVDDSAGGGLLAADEDGMPRRTKHAPEPGVRVPVPVDYAKLREAGDASAPAWRQAARDAFAECFDVGLVAGAFGSHGYLFTEARS